MYGHMIRSAELVGGPHDGTRIEDRDGWDEAVLLVGRETDEPLETLQAYADAHGVSLEVGETRLSAVYLRDPARRDRFRFHAYQADRYQKTVHPHVLAELRRAMEGPWQ